MHFLLIISYINFNIFFSLSFIFFVGLKKLKKQSSVFITARQGDFIVPYVPVIVEQTLLKILFFHIQ